MWRDHATESEPLLTANCLHFDLEAVHDDIALLAHEVLKRFIGIQALSREPSRRTNLSLGTDDIPRDRIVAILSAPSFTEHLRIIVHLRLCPLLTFREILIG
jgi:hypothetical protein